MILITKQLRKIINSEANAKNSCAPIIILEGNSAPKLIGRGYYYTNKSGDIIRFPNAYQKAWGKLIYHHSTQQIQVGKDWISKFLPLKKS